MTNMWPLSNFKRMQLFSHRMVRKIFWLKIIVILWVFSALETVTSCSGWDKSRDLSAKSKLATWTDVEHPRWLYVISNGFKVIWNHIGPFEVIKGLKEQNLKVNLPQKWNWIKDQNSYEVVKKVD